MPTLTRRSLLASTAIAVLAGGRLPRAMAAPATVAGALNIACIFDPPGLDPTVNAVDLVSMITENVFDTLYAFDANGSRPPCWPPGRPMWPPTARRSASLCAPASFSTTERP